jgi:hypothetical protein
MSKNGNGLTPKDEAALRRVLRQLAVMEKKCHLLGGNERAEMRRLIESIGTRLDPPAAGELCDEAAALFESFKGCAPHDEVMDAA